MSGMGNFFSAIHALTVSGWTFSGNDVGGVEAAISEEEIGHADDVGGDLVEGGRKVFVMAYAHEEGNAAVERKRRVGLALEMEEAEKLLPQ